MNGDMILVKVNNDSPITMEEINHVRVEEPAKKIYALTKLMDGRVCASMDKGFSLWTMVNATENLPKMVQ